MIGEACEPLKKMIEDQGTEIAELKRCVALIEANYNQDVLIFAPEHVCNVAAQILLFFCGDEPTKKPLSSLSHFIKMDDSRHLQFYAAFGDRKDAFGISRTTEEWMHKFDGMIQNCNNQIRFRGWEALWRSVTSIRGLFLRHPNLRDKWNDEYFVIQDFEQFRANQLHKKVAAKVRK